MVASYGVACPSDVCFDGLIVHRAEDLTRSGHSTRIVHVGVEKLLDPNLSLIHYLWNSKAEVVAFALHWHPQTYDTLALATQVKSALPHIHLVLGGLTAGFFAPRLDGYPGFAISKKASVGAKGSTRSVSNSRL